MVINPSLSGIFLSVERVCISRVAFQRLVRCRYCAGARQYADVSSELLGANAYSSQHSARLLAIKSATRRSHSCLTKQFSRIGERICFHTMSCCLYCRTLFRRFVWRVYLSGSGRHSHLTGWSNVEAKHTESQALALTVSPFCILSADDQGDS